MTNFSTVFAKRSQLPESGERERETHLSLLFCKRSYACCGARKSDILDSIRRDLFPNLENKNEAQTSLSINYISIHIRNNPLLPVPGHCGVVLG